MPGNVSASWIKFRYSLSCQVSHIEAEIDLASISFNLDYIHLHFVTSLLLFYSTIPNGSPLSKYINMPSTYDQEEKKNKKKGQKRATEEDMFLLQKHRILKIQDYEMYEIHSKFPKKYGKSFHFFFPYRNTIPALLPTCSVSPSVGHPSTKLFNPKHFCLHNQNILAEIHSEYKLTCISDYSNILYLD